MQIRNARNFVTVAKIINPEKTKSRRRFSTNKHCYRPAEQIYKLDRHKLTFKRFL